MLENKFCKTGLTALAMVATVAFAPSSNAVMTYSTDFESAPSGGTGFTPIGDGWIAFINQFNADGSAAGGYGYNGFQAPSDGPQVSAINTAEAGATQGAQVLSVYSDYSNRGFMTNGNPEALETLVFQEQAYSGETDTWYFGFDAKDGGVAAPASAAAFIKVLDGGFNPVLPTIELDLTDISGTWGRYETSIDLSTAPSNAAIVQFGFLSRTGNDVVSTNFYDNINFSQTSTIPVPAAVWLFGSGLVGLVGVARRRRKG